MLVFAHGGPAADLGGRPWRNREQFPRKSR